MVPLVEKRLDRGGGHVPAADEPRVVLLEAEHPDERISERSSGKMPTMSVRRPISLLKRSSGGSCF